MDLGSRPKLSIVIPTLNRASFLRHCCESIQKQTFTDYEVIIQDCLSNDDTQRDCENLSRADSRFRYFREKDAGQSDAINRGLGHSKGIFWTWICSDDFYDQSNALESLVNALTLKMDTDSQVVGAFGRSQNVSETHTVLGPYNPHCRDLTRNDFWMGWPISQPASILLTERVRQVGGLRLELFLGMDLDLFIRLLEDGRKLIFVDESIVSATNHPGAKSVHYQHKTAVQSLAIIIHHYGSLGDLKNSEYFDDYCLSKVRELISPFRNRLGNAETGAGQASVVKRRSWAFKGAALILNGIGRVYFAIFGSTLPGQVRKMGLIWLDDLKVNRVS